MNDELSSFISGLDMIDSHNIVMMANQQPYAHVHFKDAGNQNQIINIVAAEVGLRRAFR